MSPYTNNYWFDSAVAKFNPDDPESKWTCSVRGPNGGVIAWASGDDPDQTRDRCRAICRALNSHDMQTAALKSCLAFWDGPPTGAGSDARWRIVWENVITQVRLAIARAEGRG